MSLVEIDPLALETKYAGDWPTTICDIITKVFPNVDLI
jgi:hypothetical protein